MRTANKLLLGGDEAGPEIGRRPGKYGAGEEENPHRGRGEKAKGKGLQNANERAEEEGKEGTVERIRRSEGRGAEEEEDGASTAEEPTEAQQSPFLSNGKDAKRTAEMVQKGKRTRRTRRS